MSQLFPDDLNLFLRFLLSLCIHILRYVIFAGGVYLFFYVLGKRKWFAAKIQQKFPDNKHILHEIKYSLLSLAVFSVIGILMYWLHKNGILVRKVYFEFSKHSVWYFIGTTVFLIFFHDAYFYFIHRLMHIPGIYERVHQIHHESKNPTPWAAFSFHPVEAVLELAFIPLLVFTIPLHWASILILSFWQIGFNVMGHSGYELFPRNAQKTIFKWLNTSTNHNMHHKYVRCNYGLYFNFWDRLFGTNHAKYEETFEEVAIRRDEAFSGENNNEIELLTATE